MAFIQTSAALRPGARPILSADNALPDRSTIIGWVRKAAPALGLTPPQVATLDALLSCLPPRRAHHMVFASNSTLAVRRNGISERTLRRHIAALAERGLLVRQDSPNGKRFSRRNPATGATLCFGFDLGPLFARCAELSALAEDQVRQDEEIAYLRCQLRAAVHRALLDDPDCAAALAAQAVLRRKLDAETLRRMLTELPVSVDEHEAMDNVEAPAKSGMSASDGQNVRHQQNSRKELVGKNDAGETAGAVKKPSPGKPVDLNALKAACPDAVELAMTRIAAPQDVIEHARQLAPMIGIDRSALLEAERRLGCLGAAVTVWALLQIRSRIRQTGAYFRSLTSGARSAGFNPWTMIRRLTHRSSPCPCP
ncbi:plasmid replication protein RepC [Oceaniglobus roseus]|uniref:plasmid replication protein RepC n=1 Tax=Oceaniglobus roseus TaxID=1737570 RepID=UPI000C7EA82A|nr:plasmid replication protein RepC [Kandeliimicrobium roseum]